MLFALGSWVERAPGRLVGFVCYLARPAIFMEYGFLSSLAVFFFLLFDVDMS